MWPFLLVAVILSAPVALYALLRLHAGSLWLLVLCAASLAVPLLVPADLPMLRFLVGIGALVNVAKAVECLRGRAHDPAMLRPFWRFLFWHSIPPDSTWPVDDAAATNARRAGRRRLLRGAAKLPFVVGLLVLAETMARAGMNEWLVLFATLWFTYGWMSALADLVTGLAMQTGIDVVEVFNAPPLARSPIDFWSRRWNLLFVHWARRNLFLPFGGRRRPELALVAVFGVSAVAHEYLVGISLGRMQGYMTAFFLLHGVATLLSAYVARLRRGRPLMPAPAAVILHVAWLTLTAPLFLGPVMEIFCLKTMGVA
jgi:hypothetical protein